MRDAKTDSIEFTFWPMDILKGVLLAFGDSSFANVGKNRTSSQAGLIIMYAADREALLRGERVRVSPLIWKSHRIKRVVRSTLAAETMEALEAVEHADVMRRHFAELFEGIDYHSYHEDIQQISVIPLTDCRSLYDLLHRRGTVPSERRLLIRPWISDLIFGWVGQHRDSVGFLSNSVAISGSVHLAGLLQLRLPLCPFVQAPRAPRCGPPIGSPSHSPPCSSDDFYQQRWHPPWAGLGSVTLAVVQAFPLLQGQDMLGILQLLKMIVTQDEYLKIEEILMPLPLGQQCPRVVSEHADAFQRGSGGAGYGSVGVPIAPLGANPFSGTRKPSTRLHEPRPR